MRNSSSPKEHDAFQRMANGAKEAHAGAMEMSELRQDQRDLWLKVAANMKVLEGQLYDLATGGMFTREDGKFGGGKLS